MTDRSRYRRRGRQRLLGWLVVSLAWAAQAFGMPRYTIRLDRDT